jgi:hypothetical protein
VRRAGVPLDCDWPYWAVELVVTTFSTSSRPALRALENRPTVPRGQYCLLIDFTAHETITTMMLKIGDDMQIPPVNTDAYAAIYRLENWLRRICLTAYMCTHEHYVDNLMDGNDWSRFQAFAARGRDLYEFVSLPAERNDHDWPNAAALLKTFASVSHLILSFCLNLSGSEYRVLLPRALSQAEVKLVADRFFNNPQVWTTRPYEAQPLQHVCNPKIWFYEIPNLSPNELRSIG